MRVAAMLLALQALVAVERLAPGSPADLTALGNAALHNRQFDTAISHYKQALEADRSYFYALYNLGLTYQEQADASRDEEKKRELLAEAMQQYQRALVQKPDHAEVLCNIGFLAFRHGDFQIAAQRFQQAQDHAESSARSAEYAYNRGAALERLAERTGGWAAAGEAYRACIKLNPDHFDAHYNLGSLLAARLDDPAGAKRELRQAHEIDPRRPQPLVNLALLMAEDPVKAEDLFARAAAAAADHEPLLLDEVRWRRALFYWKAAIPGKTTRILARDDLQQILASQPDFPGANGLLGQYYDSIGDYPQAVTHLEREVADGHFDPGSEIDLHAHYLLVQIYTEHLRDPAKARRHATRYYELRPDGDGEALRLRAQRALGTTAAESPGSSTP